MPTGLRYPADLPPPDRDDYREAFEEIQRSLEMEAGTVRRRNRMRAAPRRFDLAIPLTQNEFALFDAWWQDTIKGGEREFDIQLLDDDAGGALVWYTVRVVDGVYSAEVGETMDYRVSFTVRAVGESFPTRAAGTDNLRSEITVGVQAAPGRILIFTPYRGNLAVGFTNARAVFSLPPLQGSSAVGLLSFTRGRLFPRPLFGTGSFGITNARGEIIRELTFEPEYSRQWMRRSWIRTTPAQDVNIGQDYQSREWMED